MRKYLGAILMATIIPLFIATAQASPDDYLIWYHEQYNDDGTSLMIIWLYRMTEAEPNYDFYIIKVRIQGMKSQGLYFTRADIWSNGVCNDWEPESGSYSSMTLSISVGGVSFGINIPSENIGTTGGLMPTFGWVARTLWELAPDKEFVSSWYVPDGESFAFLAQASEWYDPPTTRPICTDSIQVYYPHTFGFQTLTVKAGSHGTTSPRPETYIYCPAGFITSVWARPYSGYEFYYWSLDGAVHYGSPIKILMNSDHTVKAYFYSGGGGCPILSVFDGSNYATEGLLDIHNPDGIDLVYDHTLITEPAWTKGTYQFRLTEHPQTHSYIDQVKLYVMLEDGTEIKLLLIHAWHSEHGNVLPQLLRSDDVRTDTSANQTIDLKFVALTPNAEVAEFVFQIEGHNIYFKE